MSHPIIFITGATGFIGAHVVSQALDAGFHVRLSVRKESQTSNLKNLFGKHAANVEFVIVPELEKPGAFDQVLEGVQYVFHVASPMPGAGDDFKKDYLAPAVQGTEFLLEAAKKIATIERVVIVSSLLSLAPLGALGSTEKFHIVGKYRPPCKLQASYPSNIGSLLF
jgi:nucleoside-diphosphate-sugar epimerase